MIWTAYSLVAESSTTVALIGLIGSVIASLTGGGVAVFGVVWNAHKQTESVKVEAPNEVETEPECEGCGECLARLAEVRTDRDYWRLLALDKLGIDRREH